MLASPPDRPLLRCVRAEFAKLRGSLALVLCIIAPATVAVLMALIFNRHGGGDTPWRMYLLGNAATWAYFMLPMTVTALTVLAAQMEHGPRLWSHLLALPIPRRHIFFAKACAVMLLCAGMTALLALLAPLLGYVSDAVTPGRALTGPIAWSELLGVLSRIYASAWLLVSIQLWAALRWRSFVPPLALGIGGTFVAVAATGSELGPYFPWLIPTNALATDPASADIALAMGIVGGALCTAAMAIDLARRPLG
ncbi:ABC transporter permease [Cognatilysobacter bugurensis]|uniref:ABC transporter n=1 Tax=Cognatilysobacter bugurensis TaxID=543356 RepID=A0A918T1U5_9GAMM|nr:ABC transporter permease [Lysobacter bugurensis]GHA86179.1 ABC transporter [Lysobacter bugurensis]